MKILYNVIKHCIVLYNVIKYNNNKTTDLYIL